MPPIRFWPEVVYCGKKSMDGTKDGNGKCHWQGNTTTYETWYYISSMNALTEARNYQPRIVFYGLLPLYLIFLRRDSWIVTKVVLSTGHSL